MMRLSESDAARQTGLAIARFLGFFFALILALAIVITCYTLFAGSPISQAWDAVKALFVAALVLLILAVAAFYVAGMFEGTAEVAVTGTSHTSAAHPVQTPGAGD